MVDNNETMLENIPGKFYITGLCIGCALCSEIAPTNIKANFLEGFDFFYKQPENKEEEDACREAMLTCPADAIMDDGMPDYGLLKEEIL